MDEEDLYLDTAERHAKQRYLCEEIIENGYDPGEFSKFCEQIRGTDIDQWSF